MNFSNSKTILLLFLLSISSFGKADEGIIAVMSGKITDDGQPLLCQNLSSSNPHVKLWYYTGADYDFVGVVNGNDTSSVLMGQNSVGFALVGTPAQIEEGENNQAARTMQKALGVCGRIEDFEDFLFTLPKKLVFSFACIDSYSGAALFECINNNITKYDVNQIIEAPNGFLVRSNFPFSHQTGTLTGSFRFNRAVELIKGAVKDSILNARFLRNKLLRDIQTESPPFSKINIQQENAPIINTAQSINQYNTICSIVMSGHNPKAENVPLWCALGEPICTIYLPIWSTCSELHPDLSGESRSLINEMAIDTKRVLYPNKNSPKNLHLENFGNEKKSILNSNKEVEKKLVNTIQTELAKLKKRKQHSINDICHIQQIVISNAIKQIR
jgi:hypothetical protein